MRESNTKRKLPLTKSSVLINGTIYVTKEREVARLARRLRRRGYSVLRNSSSPGWHAKLRDDVLVRMGKCDHCNGYVNVLGIFAHGRDCELCGKPLCREYNDGGMIEFNFADDHGMRSDVCMRIKRFEPSADDPNKGELILYARTKPIRKLFTPAPSVQGQTLKAHQHQFRSFKENGVAFIAIPYERGRVGFINTSERTGERRYGSVVKMFEGKEYGDFDFELPVHAWLTIKPAWNGYPLKRSPMLHEAIIRSGGGMPDIGWHYQDDCTAFYPNNFVAMRLFVKHFTKLSLRKWDTMVRNASHGGPGFIRASAAFCQGLPQPVVTNRPNIGNALLTFGKIGQHLFGSPYADPITQGEMEGFTAALADRDIRDDFIAVVSGRR